MALGGLSQKYRKFPMETVDIFISTCFEDSTITITGKGAGFIIVCYVGTTTGDFTSRRYYDVSGSLLSLEHPPAGWTIVDDGQYGLFWTGVPSDDPYSFTYAVQGGGLDVAPTSSGIPAKSHALKNARLILSGAVEDERYIARNETVVWGGPVPPAFTLDYDYLIQVDSLSYAPYKLYGNKPFMHRYYEKKNDAGEVVESGIASLHVRWAGSVGNLYYDGYISDNFRDTIPIINRIYKTLVDGSRSYMDIEIYDDASQALIAACQRGAGHNQSILRAKTHDDIPGPGIGNLYAEPVRSESYDIAALTASLGTEDHRCSNTASDECYMHDAVTISGRAFDVNGFVTDTGQSTISNDIILPYAVREDGARTYVRMQKDTEFTTHKTGLYVGGTLVGESGWQPVITLYDQVPAVTVPEANGPLVIRQTAYKILHAYHAQGFDACVFEKCVYQSHESDLMPYTFERGDNINDFCQVRRTMIVSLTTYHVAVNGIVTDLPYTCTNREYRFTVLSTPYAGPPLPQIFAFLHGDPWFDVGYDKNGTPTGEDNKNVTRIFTDSSGGMLMVSLDVFPVAFRHDIVFEPHDNLILAYDTAVATFPPSSDASNPQVSDRKWMLFDTEGALVKEVTPPQTDDDVPVHVNRINGLAVLKA